MRWALVCAWAAALACLDAASPAPEVAMRFTDVSEAAGLSFKHESSATSNKYLIETMGGGVALIDYDNDGRLDVFFTNGAKLEDPMPPGRPPDKSQPAYWNRLFRQGTDGRFTDVTEKAGLTGMPQNAYGMGVAVGDYNNDGFPDLLVTCVGLPTCIALLVTGAVATASGPHPGSSDDVERLGLGIVDTVHVHVRVAAAFGIGVLVVGALLRRLRGSYPGLLRIWAGLLGVLVAQAIVGEVQYRNALPWGLVLVHVVLAAAIWAFSLGLAYVLWRPPAQLTRQ